MKIKYYFCVGFFISSSVVFGMDHRVTSEPILSGSSFDAATEEIYCLSAPDSFDCKGVVDLDACLRKAVQLISSMQRLRTQISEDNLGTKEKKLLEEIIQWMRAALFLREERKDETTTVLRLNGYLSEITEFRFETRNETPLILACRINATSAAIYLAEHGACIDAFDVEGATALWWATINNNIDLAGVLIKQRADVDVRDWGLGLSPLHLAAQFGFSEIVSLLCVSGADKGIYDGHLRLPVYYAKELLHKSRDSYGEFGLLEKERAQAIYNCLCRKWTE